MHLFSLLMFGLTSVNIASTSTTNTTSHLRSLQKKCNKNQWLRTDWSTGTEVCVKYKKENDSCVGYPDFLDICKPPLGENQRVSLNSHDDDDSNGVFLCSLRSNESDDT